MIKGSYLVEVKGIQQVVDLAVFLGLLKLKVIPWSVSRRRISPAARGRRISAPVPAELDEGEFTLFMTFLQVTPYLEWR
jgi:hypothetical protein